jgi:Mrp family chromosome partitioning ATPase
VQQEIATLRRLSGQGRPAVPDPSRNSEAARRVVADEAEWARLSREAAEARERFQQLESRQFVASMNANMAASGQSSQIVIIDPAFLPVRPSGPSRAARALIGAFFAMVVGFGVAFVLSLTDDRVVEGEDLERLQLAPVLLDIEKANMPRELAGPPHAVAGVVRAVPEAGGARRVALANIGRHARTEPASAGTAIVLQASDPASALVRVHRPQAFQPPDPRLVLLTAPESRAAAAYRVLCHRLRERGNPRAILVTSPGRREGKSVLAANLALALVEGDRAKVVLLETHHESPTTGKLFGLEPPVGASEQIESHRLRPGQPWEALETTVPKLHVVPLAPGSTTRPLLDATITQFVAAFRLAGYEYVVIDGPDALGSADVTLMQESADALLVAVRGGVTRLRTIRAAVDQVGATKLAGFTLFGSSPT